VSAIAGEDPHFERGSVGRPLAGVSVRVVAPDGAPLPPGERGALEVRSPWQMLGYLDEPQATAGVLDDGWLRTGDLGRLDRDGYLYLDGRSDGLVKVAGERVSLDALAERLRAFDGVGAACVIAAADPELGVRLVAFIEPREGAPEDLAERVRALAPARLSPAWRPAKVVELSSLPRSGGEIDRQALRRMVEPT
jgi:acyl-CoA synthetase (AMP-forming)/AMP-acid ligase II